MSRPDAPPPGWDAQDPEEGVTPATPKRRSALGATLGGIIFAATLGGLIYLICLIPG